MFSSQKYRRGNYFSIRSTENSGGRGNPFSTIGINAFRTTNFRSSSAMRVAEFHGNTGRDSTTRILSIVASGGGGGGGACQNAYVKYLN